MGVIPIAREMFDMYSMPQQHLLQCVCCVSVCSCDSMEKLKRRCETLDGDIKEQSKFKDFYQFTFNFAKNPGQKSLGEPMKWFGMQ